MAIYVDARQIGDDMLFRLWDTQTASYATGDLLIGGIVKAIKGLFSEGGIPNGPHVEMAVSEWLNAAMLRGTNDPSKAPVVESKRAWRTPEEPGPAAGPIRVALRARVLTEQAARTICEARVNEWKLCLSPEARAFLDETYALRQLLRENGTAWVRVDRAPAAVRHGYANLADARVLVAEIADKWHDAVSVEILDVGDHEPVTFVFRLR